MKKIVHSGGASGADSLFSDLFSEYDYDVIHHSFKGHNSKSTTGKILVHSNNELYENKDLLKEICKNLNRQYPTKEYIEKLLLRNIFQIKDSELVLGVGNIINFKQCIVKGGTGYAIMYAKMKKITILFLDQNKNQWFYSIGGEKFKNLFRQPILYNFPNNFTAIGSRGLSNNSINELNACFKRYKKMNQFFVTERGEMAYQLPLVYEQLKYMKNNDALLAISKCINNQKLHKLLLEYKLSIIFHATITGFGGTKIEPGVDSFKKSLEGLNDLINKGFPAEQIVLRIDPIIPTKKGIKTAETVLLQAPSKINRIRFSFIDNYKNIKPYLPWNTFHAPTNLQHEAMKMLYKHIGNRSLEACGEQQLLFENTGCISPKDYYILKISPPTIPASKKQRKGCLCLNTKTEILEMPNYCPNGCVYCYYNLGRKRK